MNSEIPTVAAQQYVLIPIGKVSDYAGLDGSARLVQTYMPPRHPNMQVIACDERLQASAISLASFPDLQHFSSLILGSTKQPKMGCLRFPIANPTEHVTVFALENCDLVKNAERLELCCFCYIDSSFVQCNILKPEQIPTHWDWLKQVLITESVCYSYTQLVSHHALLAKLTETLRSKNAVIMATLAFAPDAIALLIPDASSISAEYKLTNNRRRREFLPSQLSDIEYGQDAMLHCIFMQRRVGAIFEPLAANAQLSIAISRSSDRTAAGADSAANEAPSMARRRKRSHPQNCMRGQFIDAFREQQAITDAGLVGRSRPPRGAESESNDLSGSQTEKTLKQKRLDRQKLGALLKQWAIVSASKLVNHFESASGSILTSLIRGDLVKRAQKSLSGANYEQFLECLNSRNLLNNILRQAGYTMQSNRDLAIGNSRQSSDCELLNDMELPRLSVMSAKSLSPDEVGFAGHNNNTLRVERVCVADHVVDVVSANDDGRWPEDETCESEKTNTKTQSDESVDGEAIIDEDGYFGADCGEIDDLSGIDQLQHAGSSTENAGEMELMEDDSMLALIREARSSRKFQSPFNVPLNVTDERMRDKLAQEAISVALRTRNRVTLQTLFGILRQHCVRIRGRSLMNSMAKLGYRFDRRLRCYVKM